MQWSWLEATIAQPGGKRGSNPHDAPGFDDFIYDLSYIGSVRSGSVSEPQKPKPNQSKFGSVRFDSFGSVFFSVRFFSVSVRFSAQFFLVFDFSNPPLPRTQFGTPNIIIQRIIKKIKCPTTYIMTLNISDHVYDILKSFSYANIKKI